MKSTRRKRRGKADLTARHLWKNQRGQSMVEYAVIAACILGGLIATSIIFLPTMIRAYDVYYKSFYAVLNLPIP